MWANTVPDGGLLAIGIEDGGKVAGCHSLSSNELNDLEKSPRRLCPDARVESKRVEAITHDGIPSFIVLFRIDYREDRVVRNHKNEAFIRHGDIFPKSYPLPCHGSIIVR
jgi:ATP-dependent DNA helicase RecG